MRRVPNNPLMTAAQLNLVPVTIRVEEVTALDLIVHHRVWRRFALTVGRSSCGDSSDEEEKRSCELHVDGRRAENESA